MKTASTPNTFTKQDLISVETGGSANLSSVADVRKLVPTQQYRQEELSDLARSDVVDAHNAVVGLVKS